MLQLNILLMTKPTFHLIFINYDYFLTVYPHKFLLFWFIFFLLCLICSLILHLRVDSIYKFPSQFLLIAAANPCPCGYFGDKTHTCKCSQERFLRISQKLEVL